MPVSLPRSAAAALGLICLGSPLAAGLSVPSGLSVQVLDVIEDAEMHTMRFRYLAPDLGDPLKRPDFDALSLDLVTLCQTDALAQLTHQPIEGVQIIVSLSDKALPFGEIDPEITQVFEAFSVKDGTCILEMF